MLSSPSPSPNRPKEEMVTQSRNLQIHEYPKKRQVYQRKLDETILCIEQIEMYLLAEARHPRM